VLKRTSTPMSDKRCTEWLLCRGHRILQLHMEKGETCYGEAEKLKVGGVVHEKLIVLSIRWAVHEAHTRHLGCMRNGGRVWRMEKGVNGGIGRVHG
jgi:transcriptional antiterminator Rof (Rho-off)